MTADATLDAVPSTDLITTDVLVPAKVFSPGGVDAILQQITERVRAVKTDMSTAVGRKDIASLARKIASSKTALDKMGKDLGQKHYDSWKAITAERGRIEATLDALRDQVRKPLTDWEDAEQARVDAHEAALAEMLALGTFPQPEPSLTAIDMRIATLATQLAQRTWQEFAVRAAEAECAVRKTLVALRGASVRRESERAELERLRQEQVARERQERDDRIAAEAADRATAQAEAVAAERQASLRRERLDAIARAERAEADAKAAAAKAERDKKTAAEVAERAKGEAVEAERKRVADAKAAEEAAAAKREANKQHVAKVNKKVADALVSAAGLDARKAMSVVAAIARGDIPHVAVSY